MQTFDGSHIGKCIRITLRGFMKCISSGPGFSSSELGSTIWIFRKTGNHEIEAHFSQHCIEFLSIQQGKQFYFPTLTTDRSQSSLSCKFWLFPFFLWLPPQCYFHPHPTALYHPFCSRSAYSLDSSTEGNCITEWGYLKENAAIVETTKRILIVQDVLFRQIILSHSQLTWIPYY